VIKNIYIDFGMKSSISTCRLVSWWAEDFRLGSGGLTQYIIYNPIIVIKILEE
jgi:hypothetical protein